jgi:hypothetical protein
MHHIRRYFLITGKRLGQDIYCPRLHLNKSVPSTWQAEGPRRHVLVYFVLSAEINGILKRQNQIPYQTQKNKHFFKKFFK